MFGKKKHNFHFLQTMLQVLVAIFVMVGEINVFSTTFVKLPLLPSYQISFLFHRLQLRDEKKHIKFVYPNTPTSSKPQLYYIRKYLVSQGLEGDLIERSDHCENPSNQYMNI